MRHVIIAVSKAMEHPQVIYPSKAGWLSWKEETGTKIRAKIKWLIHFSVQQCQHEVTSLLCNPQSCCCLVPDPSPPHCALSVFFSHCLLFPNPPSSFFVCDSTSDFPHFPYNRFFLSVPVIPPVCHAL